MKDAVRNTLLVVLVLAVVSLSARNFTGAATTTSTAPARHYYLTKATLNGNQALTACASGYHFASFVEILDPTVLTYNKTLGRSNADDGAGPPTGVFGWVRTGYASNSSTSGGGGIPTNCSLWTSEASTDNGEVGVFLPSWLNQTTTPPTYVPAVLFQNDATCDNSQGVHIGVWCVEN
jgi:hypothetical protein